MEIITEYDLDAQKRLLVKQYNLVKEICKQICEHLCKSELNTTKCYNPDFVIHFEACNTFKVFIPLSLGQEVVLYVHKHSPFNVLIQAIGAVSDVNNEEGFLSSEQVKATSNVQLRKAIDGCAKGSAEKFPTLSLTYTNALQIYSEYGDINVEVIPVIKVPDYLKGWFLKDYVFSPSYFVPQGIVTERFPSPHLVWSLSFSKQEQALQEKYKRQYLLTVIFRNKFKLKAIDRSMIMQALFQIEHVDYGEVGLFADVLLFLSSRFSSKCLYNYHAREEFNMIQFKSKAELSRSVNVIKKYLKCLRNYYCP